MADFTFSVILNNLLWSARWTVLLSLIAFVSGGIVGLGVLFMRGSENRTLRILTAGYIEFFQGTPLLMQLFLFFFGVALFGIEVSPWLAAWLALTFWTSAFLSPRSGTAASRRFRAASGKRPEWRTERAKTVVNARADSDHTEPYPAALK